MSMSENDRLILIGLIILVASMFIHGSNHRGNPRHNNYESNKHLCNFLVPTVSLKFYKHARVNNLARVPHYTRIEYCCSGYVPYKPEQSKDFACLPKCDDCTNGFCQQPGECVCYDGFVKNDDGECVFSCPVSCFNGQCHLDGSCKCNRGFKLSENRDFCRPICTIECGNNQTCSAPETCSCSKGYKLTSEGCTPVCNPKCGIGGRCIHPNVCQCYTMNNYELRNGVCQANCYQRCDNGICLQPNRCICYPGFKYSEGAKTCVPAY